MLLQQVLKISSTELILESSKWQRWAWEYFQAHYHSLLNLLASPRMTGHTLHQPRHQIEAMIRGLTDAAQSSGSHPVYSHCWDSKHSNYPQCSHTFPWKTGKQATERNASSYRPSPSAFVPNSYKSIKQFVKFKTRGQRSSEDWRTPLFLPCCRNWICAESLYKLCTAQMTCSEGDFFQYMVMRDAQLTGLYQEEAHNKGGGGGKERDSTMLKPTLNCRLRRHEQGKK